jgi:hypothetical protein
MRRLKGGSVMRRSIAAVLVVLAAAGSSGHAAGVTAARFRENPLVTLASSPSIGDNANGPAIIRVPGWVQKPLGRYYMYFAHHSGRHIRLAYADSIRGPWKVYEPGVLQVEHTAFYRPQPDPVDSPPGAYTHVASPEIYVDDARKRIVLWTHGVWTEGQRWPERRQEAVAWMRDKGYAQYTQASESRDGLHFESRPAITKQPYLRVFQHDGYFYGMARLGLLLRARDPLDEFVTGGDPWRDTPYKGRVRHVALLPRKDALHIFFSAIGDAPEGILHTTMPLTGDWQTWTVGPISQVLAPEAAYECPNLPNEKSLVGEIDHQAKQLRDPALFSEGGRLFLFYTFCGEQGIAGAEVTLP